MRFNSDPDELDTIDIDGLEDFEVEPSTLADVIEEDKYDFDQSQNDELDEGMTEDDLEDDFEEDDEDWDDEE
jgi:hypothetical protein